MKQLIFEVKRNLRKPPRIYIRSAETAKNYGSFPANEPDKFEGWPMLDENETIEVQHYMANLNAVKYAMGAKALEEQSEYRLRLPIGLADTIDTISLLGNEQNLTLDIYTPMLTALIQELKITTAKFDKHTKSKALIALDKLGLAEYKKADHSTAIKAIFSELKGIYNKSEKLHQQAKALYNKDKSYAPAGIDAMANGEREPSKWLVSCAIAVLLEEKLEIIKNLITHDDFFVLFAKQLLDNHRKEELIKWVKKYDLEFLNNEIENYAVKLQNKN